MRQSVDSRPLKKASGPACPCTMATSALVSSCAAAHAHTHSRHTCEGPTFRPQDLGKAVERVFVQVALRRGCRNVARAVRRGACGPSSACDEPTYAGWVLEANFDEVKRHNHDALGEAGADARQNREAVRVTRRNRRAPVPRSVAVARAWARLMQMPYFWVSLPSVVNMSVYILPYCSLAANLIARFGVSTKIGGRMPRYRDPYLRDQHTTAVSGIGQVPGWPGGARTLRAARSCGSSPSWTCTRPRRPCRPAAGSAS